MTEFDRIARLTRRFGAPPPPATGIGDDCAVLPPTARSIALKVDAAVEGVHFDREYLSLQAAAERAVEAALSDMAAAGASVSYAHGGGCGILCALTLPPALGEEDFDALIEGVARAAERAGAVVLGGNLAAAPVLTITTTVIGRVEGPSPGRGGARPGDKLCVTGVVGAAALGLRALMAGREREAPLAPFVRAWRAPRARIAEGLAVARFASATVDVSDGLAQDAGHVARASGCGVVIDLAALPMLGGQRETARMLGLDATLLALTGGEDYELCFTAREVPDAPAGSAGWTVIGEVVEGAGVLVRDAAGTRAIAGGGWDHFRSK